MSTETCIRCGGSALRSADTGALTCVRQCTSLESYEKMARQIAERLCRDVPKGSSFLLLMFRGDGDSTGVRESACIGNAPTAVTVAALRATLRAIEDGSAVEVEGLAS